MIIYELAVIRGLTFVPVDHNCNTVEMQRAANAALALSYEHLRSLSEISGFASTAN